MEHIHKKNIDFKEAFIYGWETVKKHWTFLLFVLFLSFLAGLPFGILDSAWNESLYAYSDFLPNFLNMKEAVFYFLFQVIYWVVSLTLGYNLQKIYLNVLHDKKLEAKDLFKLPTLNTIKYYVTVFVYGLMVIVGLIAFIVPGVYFFFKYFYASLLVLDKDMGIIEAGKRSAEITQGYKWKLAEFLLMLIVTFIAIIITGLICLIIGVIPALFIATWIATFSNLHVYRKLSA